MSGGIAYVLGRRREISAPAANTEDGEALPSGGRRRDRGGPPNGQAARREHTKSDRAWKVLALWEELVPKFVKVYPNDYRRVIETQQRFKASGLSRRGRDHGGV